MYKSNHPKIIHIESPLTRATLHLPPDEVRYELPFHPIFTNLVYVDRLRNEKWFTPMQIHDYFELCYVAEGNGWFILDGIKRYAQYGDLFITKPHEVHCGGASGDGPFTLYSLGFHFEEMNELETNYYMLGNDRIVSALSGSVPLWCEKIMKECEDEAPYALIMAKSYLIALLAEVLRIYANKGNIKTISSYTIQPFIKNVLSAIHLSINKDILIPDLASEAGVSRSHLDREFKRVLGVSPGEYARHLRLDRSKQALRQTNRSVSEIAEDMGFDSVQAFCMFFKRHSEFTPQEYRMFAVNVSNKPENEQKR
jgi:AraC family L-rhamnose operon regulatory protein RhaS